MDLLKSLNQYIDSQKAVSLYIIIFGFLLLCLSAGAFFFAKDNKLIDGLFWGSLFSGVLVMLSGILYGKKNGNIINENETIYLKNKPLFLKNESLRMHNVLRHHSTYQTIFTIIIILVIGVILSFKNAFIAGICVAVSIQFIGMMVITALSKPSISGYHQQLREAHSSNFILQDIE